MSINPDNRSSMPRRFCFSGIRGMTLVIVFLTFCSGRCSSKQAVEERVTSYVAAQEDAKAGDGIREEPAAGEGAASKEEDGKEGVAGVAGEDEAKKPEKKSLVLAAAGDIIMHGRVKGTALAQAAEPTGEGDDGNEGWWHIFKMLGPVLEKADLAVANLETPIATERKKSSGTPPILNGPAASLGAMKKAGFTIMNAANNHAYDQMRDGAAETVEAVRAAGMDCLGAGESRKVSETPLIREANGVKVAFMGWTVVLNKNFNDVKTKHKPWVNVYREELALEALQAVRPEVDLIVVSMHWGGEFDMKVGAKQKNITKKLCAGGADIIIGHGPHILHEVTMVTAGGEDDEKGGESEAGEEGRTCLVAYSLGNILSNQGLKYRYGWKPPNLTEAKNIPYTRDGIVLRVTVAKDEAGISFEAVEAVPMWTENNWLDRYTTGKVPPDDVTITPLMPVLEALPEKDKKRLLLEERLSIIKQMVGDGVTYVEI
ncbi:MAG: CapA family protein [Pseudomonadota bacterium]